MLGIFPMLLLIFSIFHGESEQILGMSGLAFGLILIAGGFAAYGIKALLERSGVVGSPSTSLRKAA